MTATQPTYTRDDRRQQAKPPTRSRLLRERITAIVPLLAVWALQVGVVSLLRNSAHQDEALSLYAGQQYLNMLFNPSAVDTEYMAQVGNIFSGMPFMYPVVGGIGDGLGGLYGARVLSLVLMLATTGFVYFAGKRLWDDNSAILGALLFVLQPGILLVSFYATYDSLALFFISAALASAIAGADGRSTGLVVLAGILLFLGAATKYATYLYGPTFMALLAYRSYTQRGLHAAFVNVMITGLIQVIGIGLAMMDESLRAGLLYTTLEREAVISITRWEMLQIIIGQAGISITLVLLGLVLAPKRRWLLAIILAGTMLLAPLYHLRAQELVSLHKHLGYGLLFAAPLGGYFLARIAGYGDASDNPLGRYWVVSVLICVFAFGVGFINVRNLYGWGNVEDAAHIMRTQVRPGDSQILTDEVETLRYYGEDYVNPEQYTDLYFFDYDSEDGTYHQGESAYLAAIDDGYFDLIIFGYNVGVSYDQAVLTRALDDSENYRRLRVLRDWRGPAGKFMVIWVRDRDGT